MLFMVLFASQCGSTIRLVTKPVYTHWWGLGEPFVNCLCSVRGSLCAPTEASLKQRHDTAHNNAVTSMLLANL